VDLVIRAAVVFIFMFLLVRLLGRRELGDLEPFDIILLVVIGDLVQQGVTQNDTSVTGAFLVISTIALMSLLFSYLSFRFRRLRTLLDGQPIVLVEDGRPIERNMRRERITMDELAEAGRLQNVASLADVRWAVLETSGQISFIKRGD
jgi:uncharacterized membrane protein YcaP (DUF421 family)